MCTALVFTMRGVLMLRDSALLRGPVLKVLPHAIDTVLLASAIGMLVIASTNPFAIGWLSTKLVALAVYIAVGFVAMRFGPTKRIRAVAWVCALVVLGYIVLVALTKTPWPL